jgi:hypothetical protein
MSRHNAALSTPRETEVITAKEYREQKAAKRGNKFGARKTVVDGETFASKAEADRWCNLKLFQHARQLRGLGRQPEYDLKVNGQLVGRYKPDFVYIQSGRTVCEDVKGGPIREADSLRMRLFCACYPQIELRIVDAEGRSRRVVLHRYAETRAA